jgi:phosphoglycerate dehydrogenase-like enzyme
MPAIRQMVAEGLTAEQRDQLATAIAPGRLVEDLGGADVAVTGRLGRELATATDLAWVHAPHAGLDGADLGALLDRGITVTSGAGRSAEALAEHALWFLLALNHQSRRFERAQRWRVWGIRGQHDLRALHGRTVLVIGTGHTGIAVGRACAALGMRVLGHRRRDVAPEPPFERVTSADRGEAVDLLLPDADAVVLATSLNDATRHLLAAPQLAAMKRGAFLVNLGRGGLVDERAMVDALRAGHLGGAATDVVAGEPLRLRSPLWRAPNLLITPHVTPRLADREARAFATLLANVGRWLRDEPLENQVGPEDVYTGPSMTGPPGGAEWYRRLARRFL